MTTRAAGPPGGGIAASEILLTGPALANILREGSVSKIFSYMQSNRGRGMQTMDEALMKLTAQEPIKAELVRLRYFAGLSIDEAAGLLGISRTTAKRYWAYARAWLLAEIDEPEAAENS